MNIKEYFNHPPIREEMNESEKETYRFLDSLGIEYSTLCHDAAFTMEECKEIERILGVHVPKNLFLCNRQMTQFYLLMLPGDKVFKTKFLSAELGCARLSFANEEQMVELLGIHPGAVSPMGLVNDHDCKVLLVIDSDLMQYEYFGCHPCVNTASVKLAMSDFINKIIPQTKHQYRIVNLKSE